MSSSSVALKILEVLSLPSDEEMLGQPVKLAKWWHDAFVGSEEIAATQRVDDDVNWLLDEHPSSLTRREILDISHPDPLTQSRRVLIASLMWGYGTTVRRRPGRVDDVAAFLANPSLGDRLSRCRNALSQGDVRDAYATFVNVRGIRSAFFTKFLYFFGRSLDADSEYPLILDTKVAVSLAWLTGYRELVALEQLLAGHRLRELLGLRPNDARLGAPLGQ